MLQLPWWPSSHQGTAALGHAAMEQRLRPVTWSHHAHRMQAEPVWASSHVYFTWRMSGKGKAKSQAQDQSESLGGKHGACRSLQSPVS